MNIISIYEKFPSQEDCILHLESIRWSQGIYCVYCGSKRISPLEAEMRHHCNDCNKSFSVTVNTIFHHTHLPLQVWFLAIALILNAKKGLSARQLARDLGINKNTAWRIGMKIREAMKYDGKLLSGIVEVDETFIGGKPRRPNNHRSKRGKPKPKNPVLGAVSRDGKVITKALSKYTALEASLLADFVKECVETKNSVVITDQFLGYNRVKEFVEHATVNHSQRYVEKNGTNTNTIESFWAIIKRGIMGQYHKVTEEYLNKYMDEFSYRYNHRKLRQEQVFDLTLENALFSS